MKRSASEYVGEENEKGQWNERNVERKMIPSDGPMAGQSCMKRNASGYFGEENEKGQRNERNVERKMIPSDGPMAGQSPMKRNPSGSLQVRPVFAEYFGKKMVAVRCGHEEGCVHPQTSLAALQAGLLASHKFTKEENVSCNNS